MLSFTSGLCWVSLCKNDVPWHWRCTKINHRKGFFVRGSNVIQAHTREHYYLLAKIWPCSKVKSLQLTILIWQSISDKEKSFYNIDTMCKCKNVFLFKCALAKWARANVIIKRFLNASPMSILASQGRKLLGRRPFPKMVIIKTL